MEPFGRNATVLATAVALGLSIRARRKQSLTRAGSLAALVVGFLLVGTGLRGFNLLVFYQIGTSATKHQHHAKAKVDGSLAGARSGNNSAITTTARGPGQVLACSLLATLLSLLHVVWYGAEQPIVFGNDNGTNDNDYSYYNASCLTCGIMAHHATCLADTLASEMGILAKSRPFLITQPWKRVPTGTNGGVTKEGFFWSLVGGFVIGLSTVVFDSLSGLLFSSSSSSIIATIVRMLLFASTCGLVGSLIDSVLGATIQQTYYDPDTKLVYQANDEGIPKSAQPWVGINLLNNEQVNLVSVALTTAVGGWILGPMFFP